MKNLKKEGICVFNSSSEMITWLVIGWAIWPGSFFLVALIGESRIPPLWKHQSKAFFPGDLTLPVMWIAMFRINMGENMLTGPLASIVSLIALFIIEISIFRAVTKLATKDRSNYPSRSANSPTKIYHDLIGYYVFPLSMAPHCVFCMASHIENHVDISWDLLWVALPLAFYILCVIYDCRKGFTVEDIEARHPANWKPIWKTSTTIRKLIPTRKRSVAQATEDNPNMAVAIVGLVFTIAAIVVLIIS